MGAAEVWLADLDAIADELRELLSADESARAERFADPSHGARWARSHGLLRHLLGGYLNGDPRRLRFTVAEHGKPALARQPRGLHFNISHSGHLALLAFAADGEVGVDVELARGPTDVLGVARRMFGAEEARRLAGLRPPLREEEFLRAWVRSEAALKYDGRGLGGADSGPSGPAPWIAELDVGADAAGALALACAPGGLRLWEWPGTRSAAGRA